jgi:peptidyl-prolyl cis-trans isomerase C
MQNRGCERRPALELRYARRMPRRKPIADLFALALLLGSSAVFAADSKPVARVGNESITLADLTRRLAKLPLFQRAALADTPDKLKRVVLDTLLVPDLLYAEEAERLKLRERAAVREREREILRRAMDRELSAECLRNTPVSSAEIKAYFEANRARFETPHRVRIWRILTDDLALARKIIADSQGVDGLKRWSQYARENSLDKATQFRDGDLGFVHPDGNTDTPTLRVDPALFAAAEQLADGELGKEPLQEGTHWAVIWRRGSAAAITRTVAQEEGSIRQVLERERLEKARQALLSSLQAKYVSQRNDSPLELAQFATPTGPSRSVPARTAHEAAAGSSQPIPSERGTR